MAAITGFTCTVSKRRKLDSSSPVNQSIATLAFGDGVLTYPTGGIPVDKAALGLPNSLESVEIIDSSGDGFVYKYDSANKKVKMFQGNYGAGAAGALTELPNTATPQSSIIVKASGY